MNQSREHHAGSPLELSESPVLSSGLARQRDELLGGLQERLVARRRQRVASRIGAGVGVAAAAVILVLVGLRYLPKQPTTRELAGAPTPTPAPSPTPAPLPVDPRVEVLPPKPEPFRITRVSGDASEGVIARLAGPTPTVRIERLTDEQLLDALARAGQPGLITIGGRVYLSGDLARGTKSDSEGTPRGPSGSLPTSDDRHG